MSKNIQLTLSEGESYKIEFKEKAANIDREIVAFANASGGSIFIGVNDNGEVTGLNIINKLKSQVQDIARNCDPSIKILLITHCNNMVLEVQVKEGSDKPYRCKDGFFLRTGPSAQKLKRDEIISIISESGKIHFDEWLNKKFIYPQDFSNHEFDKFLKVCGLNIKSPINDILISLNLAQEIEDRLLLTNTAVLFFANKPQLFFPESYITCVKYKTTDRFSIIDKKDFMNSPIQQIDEAMAFLIRHMSAEYAIKTSTISPHLGRRREIYEYPIAALREAVINAVAHRDYYYDGSHIYIHMYSDCVEIENPGGLYHGLTLEKLGTRSVRRNRLIADMLHRAGYIERVGSGFDRMKHALEENQNPPMEISPTNFFNIRFYPRVQSDLLENLTTRQNQLYHVTKERGHITKREAATALNVSDDTALRELNVLIQHGLIEKHGIGKATVYRFVIK